MRGPAPILIAGGGIGGLTAALALSRNGIASRVFERSAESEQSGSGIQLGPNATRILIDLGLGDALDQVSCRPDAIRFFDGVGGGELTHMPLGETIERRHGAPYLVMLRQDLRDVLREAVERVPGASFEAPVEIESFSDGEDGVEVRSVNGDRYASSALIGADGMWSRVRSAIHSGEPRFAGYAAWRALLPMDGLPPPFADNATGVWLGPSAHIVHYPVKSGAALNLVAVVREGRARSGWNNLGAPGGLARHFSGWCDPVRATLARAAKWRGWSLYRMRTPRHWSKGHVTLLGDAAHPVLPYLAQGAALAIEDADYLARALKVHESDVASALERYSEAHTKRALRVQRHAARLGALYHLRGPARLIRNRVLAASQPERLLADLDWLYGQGRQT